MLLSTKDMEYIHHIMMTEDFIPFKLDFIALLLNYIYNSVVKTYFSKHKLLLVDVVYQTKTKIKL